MPISALDLPHGPLGGPVSDCGQVGSDLLVDGGEALAVLSAEAGLLFLVDDLVEPLVQEDGQPLPLIIGGGDETGVVVGDLGDVIRCIDHTWMIGRDHQNRGGKRMLDYYDMLHHATQGKAASALSRYLE